MRATKYVALALLLILSLTLLLHGNLPQISSGTWTPTNNLAEARSGSAAVVLDDGRVLITGGTGSTGTLTSAELFNTDGSISVAAPMLDPRTHHTAVMLKDGRVLVAGGTTSGGGTTSAAEIYDPAGNSWTAVPGGMTSPRSSHTASLLSDGRVLVAGGATTAGATNTLEVYSPDTNSFTAVTSGMLSSVRQEHAAAVLADGRILIAGGSDGAASLNSTDIFDPATGSVAAGPAMASARAGLSATTLLDGKVLLTGGNNGSADLSTAEVYNASTGSISATGGLATPRRDHLALLLPHNNGVLITGGSSAGAPLASAELFYPWTGAFTATGAMASPRTAAAGAALKQDGYLLVAGGSDGTNPLAATELYGFATIKTDKADYAPGQTVTISGSGWQPGETVTLSMVESPLLDTHGPFTAVADSNGNITNIDFVPDEHDVNILFYLTATGSVSQAQTTFTDAGNASSGDGSMTVNPTIVAAGNTGNTLTFTFTGDNAKDFNPGSQATILVPAGWTAPTVGNVAVAPGPSPNCAAATLASATGGVITVNMTCAAKAQFTVTFSGVTAPGTAGINTFTTKTKQGSPAGALANIGSSPTVTVQAASKLVFDTQPTNTQAGSSIAPAVTVQVQDANGDVVNTSTASITMAIGTNPGSGALSGATTVSAVNGVATFSNLSINKAANGYRLSATSGALTAATSNTFNITPAASTTTLSSSAGSTTFGQSVTFTATVAGVGTNLGPATGTVTFKDGATTLGTGTLNGAGVATLSTSSLSVAGSPHSITAVYGGDTNLNTSSSNTVSQTVTIASTTNSLTSSVNPSVFGQSVTFTATVAAVAPGAGNPTGTVTFKDGAATLGTGTLSGGVATFSTTALSVAGSPHSITASYATDGNFASSTSSAVSQVVNQASTTTALTSSANPSVFGQSVTFTATVAAVAPGAGTPTGTVTFKEGATTLGTGTLSSGVATFSTSSLSVATHPITAVYGSDTNFSGSTSAVLNQVVNKANTSTVVTSSVNPSQYGQAVTLTATVTAVAPGAGMPTSGSVQFFDGATSLGTGTLNASGVATITTSALTAGSHNAITAVFTSGDGNFNGSTSAVFSQSVSMADSTTTVASSLNPSQFGQSVTFTATVTYGSPAVLAAGGCITFMDNTSGATLANNVLLASGQATFTTSSLTAGSHDIQANFKDQGAGCNADNNLQNSHGNVTQVVNKADTTTAVTSSLNPSVFGQSVTFTATVAPVAPATATPTGTVTFKDGATVIGTGTLNASGVATFGTSALSVATHPITAVYGGSTSYNTSTSASLSQVVNQASTATAVTSSLNPSTAGQSVTFTATVTAVAPGAGIPSSGTVTFMDGATSLGSGPLNASGVATFSTSALSVSLSGHSITAAYGGNTNFAGSTSSAILQVVNPASTTTTVSSSLNPSNYGQSVTFTATVTSPGGTPAGTVDFKDGATTIGTGTLSGGTATFSTSALAVGTHSITAVYGENGNFAGSTSLAISQVVNAVATSTSILSSLNPSFLGQSVTFTATVAPAAATGTVNFFDGPTLLGSGALVAGNATYTTTALTLGSHSITAVYLGDGNFTGSTSPILTQVVKSAVTTTTVESSLNPSTFGASVTFTATVTPQDASAGTPGGNVTFYEGGDCTSLGSVLQVATALDGAGKATYNTASLSAGAHIVVACYGGNSTFNPSGGSVTQNVTQATTTTVLTSSKASSTLGELVMFNATVSSTSGTPSGNVYIYDGTTLIGGGTLTAGATAFSTAVLSAGAGPHSLTAAYGGDTNFSPSNSSAISQTVGPRGTMTAVSLSPDTVAIGQASTATLTVTDKTEFGPAGTPGVFVGPATALTYGRSGHTATRLPNGMVMVIGGHGSGVLTQVELCNPDTGTCNAPPTFTATARTGHTATLLNNGKVLIVGGSSDGTATGAMNSVELFDPLMATFSPVASLGTARFGHTATLLPDGTVLIAGGQNSSGTALNTTEVYAGATWSAGGPLMTARAGHAAALLPNGKVLMTGGDGTSSAELYTPGSGSIATVGLMSTDRTGHTATLLPDGNVLIAGGTSSGTVILDSTELYNAAADTFIPVNATGHNLNAARSGHTATMLDSAHVLILGGSNAISLNSEELYTPPFDPLGKVKVTSSEATDVIAGSPCDLVLSGTGATNCAVTDTPAQVDTNPHTITGNYQPATDYVHSASSATKDLTVTKADTTTLVTSSVNPSKFGQGVTFTATVTAVGSVTANLAGTVQFYDNGSPIGGPMVVSGAGTATYSPASLTVGTHPITAIYSGNTNYNTSTSTGLDQVVQKSDTSTALISSPNPSVFGQSVTFTATVTAVPPGSGTPTGTVTFYDGATSLGTGTLDGSGHTTFSTTSLSVASHPITAKFGGDGNFKYSTSPNLSQVVDKADTTTVATSSANPSKFGQSVTLTATVSVVSPGAGTPGGTVTFYDGATSVGTGTLNASGQATLSSAALSVGIHSITATYGGDGSFNNSTSPALSQEVQKADTTMAVVSAPNPSKFGQSVTLTATVAVVAPGAGTPTGTVSFFDGLTNLGTSSLTGTQATLSTAGLSVGSHSITAKYNGDGNFKYSTSPATNQEVQKADTNTAVSSSANPSKFGQSIILTATVTVLSPGTGTPSGTVTFYDGATSLGTGTLNGSGVATYPTSPLSVATHAITATYGSDTNFNGSTSAVLNQDVQKADTATVVVSNQNPSTFGQSVTFTATVGVTLPGAGTPTGTVTFYDGAANLGTSPLSGNQATFASSALLAGSHSITAKYSGDTNFKYSTSVLLSQTVNKAGTATAGSSSPNPSTYGQPVSLSAAITVVAPGAGSPTGSVTFWEGSTNLGSGTVSGSGATLTISTLTAGMHSITANYSGDDNFLISVSPAFNQVVQKANTTTVAVSSVTPSKFGQPVTVTATLGVVSPGAGNPTGSVTFYDGAGSLGTFPVSGGQASVTTASLAVGSHGITAKYSGDLNFNDSTSAAINQVVEKAGTASAVLSSLNPSTYGFLVTLTANVSVMAPGAGTPTGNITFMDGATAIGSAPVSGGMAMYSTTAFAVGVHSFSVVYSGDVSFVGSNSAPLSQTVNQAPTLTTMTSTLNTSISAAATFNFKATVASTTIGIPTGTVSFLDNGSPLPGSPVALSTGVAMLNNVTLVPGPHVVVAHYNGDFSFLQGDSPSSSAPQPIITGPPSGDVHAVNTSVSFAGTFTDSPSGETHTAAWSFDSTASKLATVVEPSGSTPGSAPTTYSFSAAGVYSISLAVNDGVGGIGIVNKVNSDLPAMEVIYDPNGGFVTGGGWIMSYPGAYVPNPALTGKANFGFVSKYQKGATIPTGETEFNFQVGNLNFHSTSYDWLVISGTQAQYKGTGTINGAGSFNFMLTASDGSPDGFRIKITDPANGGLVVYDNKMSPGDDSIGNTQAIGGGSVVIHK